MSDLPDVQLNGGGTNPAEHSNACVDETPSKAGRRSRNTITAQQTSSGEVPEAVRTAIREWKPPSDEYVRCPVPKANKSRSTLYDWGVRYELAQQVEEADCSAEAASGRKQRQQLWDCLANESCRSKRTTLRISSSTTTGATQHLKSHQKVMLKEKGILTESVKEEVKDRKYLFRSTEEETLFQDDPTRFLQVSFVKGFVIDGLIAFDYMEHREMRDLYTMMNPLIKAETLDKAAVIKLLVEVYAATSRSFAVPMLETVKASPIPVVYVSVDVWRSEADCDRFIGLRVSYVDKRMVLRSHILAVKLFDPEQSASAKSRGDVIMTWVRQVLSQYGLREEDIAGSVTNTLYDLKNPVASGFQWESSIPHMLDRVTAEGSGMAETREMSENVSCRDLVESMKGILRRFDKASKIDRWGETEKESNSKESREVQHRFVSLAKTMERFLGQWDAIELFCMKEDGVFPLANKKDEVEEVYSIVRAVKVCVQYCDTSTGPTGQGVIQQLLLLMATTLNPGSPLVVQHEFVVGEETKTDGAAESRRSDDLSATAIATRLAFHKAIARRLVNRRYGRGMETHSHLYDMAMLLCPNMRNLKYLDVLRDAGIAKTGRFTKPSSVAKETITSKLTSLVAQSVEAERVLDSTKSRDGEEPDVKRRKVSADTERAYDEQMQVMRAMGIVDSITKRGDALVTDQSSEEEAQAIVKKWLGTKIPTEFQNAITGAETCDFWRKYGNSVSPHLKRAAQAILGAPTSSAVLEHEFRFHGTFVRRRGGSFDPVTLEMLLFLNASYDCIPLAVPKLNDEEMQQAIPDRLTDPIKLEEVQALDPFSFQEDVFDWFGFEDSDLAEEDSVGVSEDSVGASEETESEQHGNDVELPGEAKSGQRGEDVEVPGKTKSEHEGNEGAMQT